MKVPAESIYTLHLHEERLHFPINWLRFCSAQKKTSDTFDFFFLNFPEPKNHDCPYVYGH